MAGENPRGCETSCVLWAKPCGPDEWACLQILVPVPFLMSLCYVYVSKKERKKRSVACSACSYYVLIQMNFLVWKEPLKPPDPKLKGVIRTLLFTLYIKSYGHCFHYMQACGHILSLPLPMLQENKVSLELLAEPPSWPLYICPWWPLPFVHPSVVNVTH